MNDQRRTAVILATLTLLWNMYGLAGNFFEHYWGSMTSLPVTFIAYLANALLLIGLAVSILEPPRGIKVLILCALMMAVWSLGGTIIELAVTIGLMTRQVAGPPLNFAEPPPLLGPLLPMIIGALTALFAWRSLGNISLAENK